MAEAEDQDGYQKSGEINEVHVHLDRVPTRGTTLEAEQEKDWDIERMWTLRTEDPVPLVLMNSYMSSPIMHLQQRLH